ncbi:MAG TPA: hypothetical protein VKN14_05620 [Flavobacteriaceae bacterium]|nr:hypothetical protein [Flavobacteriaceae bacterium]
MLTELPNFILIIDTNSYAGNFERQITAFCTGMVGEYGIGDDYAKMFKEAHPDYVEEFLDIVTQWPDDHGCPTAIWRTKKGGKYNSVAIFFDKKPSKKQLEFIKNQALKFSSMSKYKGPSKILGLRLIKPKIHEDVLWTS